MDRILNLSYYFYSFRNYVASLELTNSCDKWHPRLYTKRENFVEERTHHASFHDNAAPGNRTHNPGGTVSPSEWVHPSRTEDAASKYGC
jgi:hypothetical protein